MQRFKQIALVALLLGISSVAHAAANGTAPTTAVLFPPDAGSCSTAPGQLNILTWDGQHNIRCVHVPSCGKLQILSYDEPNSRFNCYPDPNGAAPTAQFPSNLNVVNVMPNPDPQTIPQMPPGVTPVAASGSDPSMANGLVTTQGQ